MLYMNALSNVFKLELQDRVDWKLILLLLLLLLLLLGKILEIEKGQAGLP